MDIWFVCDSSFDPGLEIVAIDGELTCILVIHGIHGLADNCRFPKVVTRKQV